MFFFCLCSFCLYPCHCSVSVTASTWISPQVVVTWVAPQVLLSMGQAIFLHYRRFFNLGFSSGCCYLGFPQSFAVGGSDCVYFCYRHCFNLDFSPSCGYLSCSSSFVVCGSNVLSPLPSLLQLGLPRLLLLGFPPKFGRRWFRLFLSSPPSFCSQHLLFHS